MPVAKAFFDVLKVDKLGTHGIGRHRSLRRQKSESIERVGLAWSEAAERGSNDVTRSAALRKAIQRIA